MIAQPVLLTLEGIARNCWASDVSVQFRWTLARSWKVCIYRIGWLVYRCLQVDDNRELGMVIPSHAHTIYTFSSDII